MTFTEITVVNDLNELKKQNEMIIWLLTFLINEITDAKLEVNTKNYTAIVGRQFKK